MSQLAPKSANDVIDLELYLHIGPHKTGSTSIQDVLNRYRNLFISDGFFVPLGLPAGTPGHHVVPYALQGASLINLGITEPVELLSLLVSWTQETISTHSRTMVLSAEDFSTLSPAQWTEFGELLRRVESMTSGAFTEVRVIWTDRDVDIRAQSGARELIKHGSRVSIQEASARLRDSMVLDDLRVLEVPHFLGREVIFQSVTYQHDGFLRLWCESVFGAKVAETLPIEAWDTWSNLDPGDEYFAELLAFNRVNTPVELDDALTPFAVVDSPDLKAALDRLADVRRLLLVSEFDEEMYLLSNPDVARAVADGDFASGREHYEIHGRYEGRVWSRPNRG